MYTVIPHFLQYEKLRLEMKKNKSVSQGVDFKSADQTQLSGSEMRQSYANWTMPMVNNINMMRYMSDCRWLFGEADSIYHFCEALVYASGKKQRKLLQSTMRRKHFPVIGTTPLMFLSRDCLSKIPHSARIMHANIKRLLEDPSVDANARDRSGFTFLHYITCDPDRDLRCDSKIALLAAVLQFERVDIEAVDRFGRTPLWYAVESSALETSIFLLGKGANLDVRDNDNVAVLEMIGDQQQPGNIQGDFFKVLSANFILLHDLKEYSVCRI